MVKEIFISMTYIKTLIIDIPDSVDDDDLEYMIYDMTNNDFEETRMNYDREPDKFNIVIDTIDGKAIYPYWAEELSINDLLKFMNETGWTIEVKRPGQK